MSAAVPEKPGLEGLEQKWGERWEANGTYRFDRRVPRENVYAIDTPPPTVSGSLHVGSVFGYVQQDTVARYRRMAGAEVFYPMGWDDNGLPTERRVENYFGVRCDASLPYDPAFEPPEKPDAKRKLAVSRPNFVELCHRLTAEDEKAFEAVWRRLGLSVDWSLTYATIDERSQRTSQRAFLRNLARGDAYQAEAPTLWDVTFQTAVAQAELEDRELAGAYHRIRFRGPDGTDGGGDIEIETTRPELIPACVALVAHPDDARFRDRFGTTVRTPLFGVEVPVLAHELADPEKGSGMAMICTFGDVTDVVWWRELGLPMRSMVRRNGRIQDDPPPGVPHNDAWRVLAGATVKQAQAAVVELLRDSGELVGEPRPVTHAVKFFEKGDRPLEIVTSRQWFIRVLEHRDDLLRLGRELRWHPANMRARYESWVQGLNTDWLVSRQRFFGVPIPLWYRLDDDGAPVYDQPLVPAEDRLPIDPSTDVPDGFTESQRGQAGGFTGDPDVMDTWATSSLTPQIATGWADDADLFGRTFPMNLRPQGPEIIRTWLFVTVVRARAEHGGLPWTDAMINGWVLDPDRKKMSKSKGNVVTPMSLLEQYGSDAVRYWADSGRPGTDTAFDEGQMRIGRRLAIKILNASKFALAQAGGGPAPGAAAVTAPLDRALLARLSSLVAEATGAFADYDYARALERTEAFFWAFCDDYLELVKGRVYGGQGEEGAASAHAALTSALSVLLRLFAPFLPYVTEEVWSWWREGSVHRAPWPVADELQQPAGGDTLVLEVAGDVLGEVRKAKSAARVSMRADVRLAVVRDTPARLAALAAAAGDVRVAGSITELTAEEAEEFSVKVELA
ncbi:MAG: valine--tRNA ligase [Actinomycetota bacterium]|nr:valine--tRNA ligase [Actinomycetota bacterium]